MPLIFTIHLIKPLFLGCSRSQCPPGARASPGPVAAALTSFSDTGHVSGHVSGSCTCQCDGLTPTYREDQGRCVARVAECQAAQFITGETSESIPFVFLPLPGQVRDNRFCTPVLL